jgi:hypothetical protein
MNLAVVGFEWCNVQQDSTLPMEDFGLALIQVDVFERL